MKSGIVLWRMLASFSTSKSIVSEVSQLRANDTIVRCCVEVASAQANVTCSCVVLLALCLLAPTDTHTQDKHLYLKSDLKQHEMDVGAASGRVFTRSSLPRTPNGSIIH